MKGLRRIGLITLCLVGLLATAGWGQGNGWKWLTGGNLKAVKFIGQQGWIIGDDGNQGIILHTTNGGDTWAIQPHNTGKHYFNGLSFSDSLNGIIVGGEADMGEPGFILKTSDGGKTWSILPSLTAYNLNRVCFYDLLHIWITSDTNAIFRSTDGGNTWEGDSVDSGYQGIDFVSLLKGWAFGGGAILHFEKTTDGGRTWIPVRDNTTGYATSIDMVDSLIGKAAGIPTQVVLTNDGWQTWTVVPCGGGGSLNDISFHDSLNGLMVGGGNNHTAQYYRTTDGGLTWRVDSLTKNLDFYGVDAKQLPVAWMAGDGGSVLKTTTSGNSWTVLRNTDVSTATLLNVTFYDANQGWATGQNGITHTTNGGTVWTYQATTGGYGYWYGVDFPDSLRGWACSDGASIITTSNGGNTWGPESSNATYSLFSIDFLDTLFGVAVGGYYGPPGPPKLGIRDRGRKDIANFGLRIANFNTNGEILSPDQVRGQNDSLRPWGTGLDFWKWPWKPGETALLTPYRTITRTTNGGALWIAQNNSGQVPLYGVSVVSRSQGWACGDPQGGYGVILHTTDGGATWQGQFSNVSLGLYWIQFRDSLHGWTVGDGGTALWTTNGGGNWNLANSGTTQQLLSCAFYDTMYGFACGANGLIIKTTDGGRNWVPDTSQVHSGLAAVYALDSLHVWCVGSAGMVLGLREAGVFGVEAEGQRSRGAEGKGIALEQSYPNPMKEECAIGYWLPSEAKPEISIYDITGRRIRFFAPLRMTTPGRHMVVWDGRDETGRKVPPGVYFYQLRGKGISETKKLVKIQ